jgi:drug/metabolite transporter (DMT)-like permease
MAADTKGLPAAHGVVLALLSAMLFGASTPLLQRVGVNVGGWLTAACLYAGAGVMGFLLRADAAREAKVRREHWPRLAAMALFGAVLGPASLAWGLQHTSGVGASLMLTSEAIFTATLAALLYGEHISRRVAAAISILTLGGACVALDGAEGGTMQLLGVLAVLGATVAWGMDNTLSRSLAHLDPDQVVWSKALLGCACSLLLAAAAGQTNVSLKSALLLMAIGAAGYGASLRFYLLAQRSIGAARTGSVFATAPFIGALMAWSMGERSFSSWLAGGAILMAVGVLVHTLERHQHEHAHEAIEHEHAHSHADGHHAHRHVPMPVEEHSHWHRHDPQRHEHPHAPDLHHSHSH